MSDKMYYFQGPRESILLYYWEMDMESGWVHSTKAAPIKMNTRLAAIPEAIDERHM